MSGTRPGESHYSRTTVHSSHILEHWLGRTPMCCACCCTTCQRCCTCCCAAC